MKVFKIISHPYALVLSFCFIMISGEHTGGFYALYLLTGLPYGIVYALVGVAAILIILLSHHFAQGILKQAGNVAGLALLFISLVLFFKNDTNHYNRSTFEHAFPMFTVIFTALIGVFFLVSTFWQPLADQQTSGSLLSKS